MISAAYMKRLATALAGAALAGALVVSGASADPHAIDAHNRAANPPAPSSIAAPASDEYQDLRSPDARDAAEDYHPTLDSQPVVDEPSEPGGFDWVSAAIGAVAAAGLTLVLMATLGMRRPTGRRAARA